MPAHRRATRNVVNVFSRGRNFGYSAAAPGVGAAVAIELSRFDAISEFDEKLGYVRIQAAVTFAQLTEFLSARGSRRFLPVTGGPADGSVLANTVERGHGLGYGGDRYAHSCRYQIVTARGECFETGFGRFEGSRVANLMRSGVGPSLDGLFTQSSLGIVTAVTLWLPRRPRYHTTFLITTRSRERTGDLFATVGEAARQSLVRDGCSFAMGGYKLASILLRREDFGAPGNALGWVIRDLSAELAHGVSVGFRPDASTSHVLNRRERARYRSRGVSIPRAGSTTSKTSPWRRLIQGIAASKVQLSTGNVAVTVLMGSTRVPGSRSQSTKSWATSGSWRTLSTSNDCGHVELLRW